MSLTDLIPTTTTTEFFTSTQDVFTTSTTSFSTPISRPPLITPFVQPPSCTDIFITTSATFVVSYSFSNHTSTLPLFLSDAANPSLSACHAPGWDSGDGLRDKFSFSPAVCPSGWTAYDIRATTRNGDPELPASTTSTAHCCSKGYTFGHVPIAAMTIDQDAMGWATEGGWGACWRGVSKAKTRTESPNYDFDAFLPAGIRMHPAYHIAWQASDASTLSPAPPATVCTMGTIDKWVPGKKAKKCHESESGLGGLASVMWFVMVGIPLLALFTIGGCVWCCCAHKRHKRLDAKEAARSRAEGNGVVSAI
ncbi:hypothetical protein QBC43DRAFT_54378 [Cladorrhinum sp. PSN259]|nr:hypothetical protein QBC43DRAFT_54378 [Cladorrhinum sp. PSN259]